MFGPNQKSQMKYQQKQEIVFESNWFWGYFFSAFLVIVYVQIKRRAKYIVSNGL